MQWSIQSVGQIKSMSDWGNLCVQLLGGPVLTEETVWLLTNGSVSERKEGRSIPMHRLHHECCLWASVSPVRHVDFIWVRLLWIYFTCHFSSQCASVMVLPCLQLPQHHTLSSSCSAKIKSHKRTLATISRRIFSFGWKVTVCREERKELWEHMDIKGCVADEGEVMAQCLAAVTRCRVKFTEKVMRMWTDSQQGKEGVHPTQWVLHPAPCPFLCVIWCECLFGATKCIFLFYSEIHSKALT